MLTKLLAKAIAAYKRLPVKARKLVYHVAIVGAATFLAVAAPLLPAVIATPSLSAVHALVVSAAAAALAAMYAALKPYLTALSAKIQAAAQTGGQ
jgi:VIT1/CCC1 family predicted Fe2+/Mn2+ transporter